MAGQTQRLIEEAISRVRSFGAGSPEDLRSVVLPPTPIPRGIPTLSPDVYREVTPMLAARYALLGRWQGATHGHWLSMADMEALWRPTIEEPLLEEVRDQRIVCEENWPNDVAALFRPERLSLFAGSDLGYERMYLVWFDFTDEPEVWAYDANGESRYRDLEAYLRAYLSDDVSAAGRPWRLEASG